MIGGSAAAAGSAAVRRPGRRNQSSIMATRARGPASHARMVAICITMGNPSFASDPQYGQECFLRYLHRTHLLHALLAGLLLLEQLALARHVAAVALGEHVLAQRLDGR